MANRHVAYRQMHNRPGRHKGKTDGQTDMLISGEQYTVTFKNKKHISVRVTSVLE